MPIAVRGCRSRMSLRSGKQSLAWGSLQTTGAPSTTSSGNPLTNASTPLGRSGVRSSLPVPCASPLTFSFTQPVWLNATPSCWNAIHP